LFYVHVMDFACHLKLKIWLQSLFLSVVIRRTNVTLQARQNSKRSPLNLKWCENEIENVA
jgi:hypothetical protein